MNMPLDDGNADGFLPARDMSTEQLIPYEVFSIAWQ